MMDDARSRMSGMAARDESTQARAFADTAPEPAPEQEQETEAAQAPWEGESRPLGLGWRLLILAGLVAAELPVQFYVFDYFLGGSADTLAMWLSLATGAIIVFGPFVASTLLRTRAATGADRRIGYSVLVLVAAWLLTIVVLGMVRGLVFQSHVSSGQVHVGVITVVLTFVALLVVVGAMSFMLGLARRHPFQDAYARSRARRDRLESQIQTAAGHLNPAYHAPAGDGPDQPDAQEQAIREAYAAAENAYYAALAQTIGDPLFTEAVQHRRGLRTVS
jgi:hypothetical protein